jgi:hypothetical protein
MTSLYITFRPFQLSIILLGKVVIQHREMLYYPWKCLYVDINIASCCIFYFLP